MTLRLLIAAGLPVIYLPFCPPMKGAPPATQLEVQKPFGRVFPARVATFVELLGADGERVWERLRKVVTARGIPIAEARWDGRHGVLECARHELELAATLNDRDYHPPELVHPRGAETVRLKQRYTFHLDAHPTGLVRLWLDATSELDPSAPRTTRLPPVLGEAILREVVAPLGVVAQWRLSEE